MGMINSMLRRKPEEPTMTVLSAEVIDETPVQIMELPAPEPKEVKSEVQDAPVKKKRKK